MESSIIYLFYLIVTGSGSSKYDAKKILFFSVVSFVMTAYFLVFKSPKKARKPIKKSSSNTANKTVRNTSLINGLIKEFDYVLSDLIEGKISSFSYDDKNVISNYLEAKTESPVSFDGGGQSTTFRTKDKIILVEIKASDIQVVFDEQPHYEVYANQILVRDLTDILNA